MNQSEIKKSKQIQEISVKRGKMRAQLVLVLVLLLIS